MYQDAPGVWTRTFEIVKWKMRGNAQEVEELQIEKLLSLRVVVVGSNEILFRTFLDLILVGCLSRREETTFYSLVVMMQWDSNVVFLRNGFTANKIRITLCIKINRFRVQRVKY